jgi:hypothetical protein
LTSGYERGISNIEAVDAVSTGNTRYVGVRLAPSTEEAAEPDLQHHPAESKPS